MVGHMRIFYVWDFSPNPNSTFINLKLKLTYMLNNSALPKKISLQINDLRVSPNELFTCRAVCKFRVI
jgi:hypothetical protein